MSPVKACPSLSSCFVKQGKRIYSSKKKPHGGILHESSDWKLSVDFDSSLVFPSFIAITGSRPDIVIYSVLKKTVILIDPFCRKAGACNTVLRVKPRLINVFGSLNCSFIMTYVMLTTFISYFTLLVLWLSGKTE